MIAARIISCAAVLLPALPASAGVWAHYSFDTDYSDVSGNNRHGTLVDDGTAGNSGIISTPGNFKFGNGAMNFHADRDFVAIPSKTFGSGSTYTVAFWARKAPGDTGEAGDLDMVIGQRENSNHFLALHDTNGAGIVWRGSSTSADRGAEFTATRDYEWHHYAMVAYGTNVIMYVDGKPAGSVTGKLTGFIMDTIGEAHLATSDYDFNGQIDEVWIFDEPLGPDKISSLYQSNDPDAGPPFAGFHYRFDGDFNDSGTGAFHASLAGGAALISDPELVVKGSGAVTFDGGDNSRVALPMLGYYTATQPWSATWWARREGSVSKGMVMGRADNTNDFIWLNDANTGLRFRSSTGSTLEFTSPKDNQLRHYALVADGAGNMTLYMDGQESQTLSGNTAFAVDSIGKAYPTNSLKYSFQGMLDEVRLMPSALTASQVTAIYDAEKPTVEPLVVTKVRIVLVGGQSNADGRAPTSGLPAHLQTPQSDVDFYYRVEGGTGTLTTLQPGLSESSQFGPEVMLGRRLADLYAHETGTRVAVIKYANGNTNLHTQWKAGGNGSSTGDGPEYVTFNETVSSGLAALGAKYPDATLDIDSMVWMQGEADASAAYSGLYQANLTTFIADIRSTYGASVAFVIGQLSSFQTTLNAESRTQVRAAQAAVAAADPRTAVVSTDTFQLGNDNLHFNATGQQSLGSGFADESAYYAWAMENFSAADIDAGKAEPDADLDGDGQSNLSEFLGASNPASGESRFMASFNRTSATAGTISYVSTPSRFYAVERLVIESGLWQLELPYARGDEGTTVRSLTTPAGKNFYRVTSKLP